MPLGYDEEIRPLTIRRGPTPVAAAGDEWAVAGPPVPLSAIKPGAPSPGSNDPWAVAGPPTPIQNAGGQAPASPPAASPSSSGGVAGGAPASEWQPAGPPEPVVRAAPSIGERIYGALPHASDLWKAQEKNVKSATSTMSQGLEDVKGGKPFTGALELGLGGIGYVASPFDSAVGAIVGEPIKRLTGSQKLGDLASFAASILLPGKKLTLPFTKSTPGKVAKTIFSADKMSPEAEAAAGSIRAEGGQAARNTAQTAHALEEHQKLVSSMDDMARRNFISYVEGNKGAALSADEQVLADKLATAYKARRTELENIDRTQHMNFVEDYFVHLWEDPQKAAQVFARGTSKEGRTGFTKGRSLPTIEDGLAAGLTPKTLDPIAATMEYISNADRFIATEHVFEEARNLGTIKYYQPGRQPVGWTKVNGRLGEKGTMDAYAPADWARVYNNFIDKGIQGPWRDAYDMAQRASNAVTSMELGLSAYHATTMAKEAFTNQFATALEQLVGGKFKAAAKSLAEAPISAVSLPMKGNKLEQVYLGAAPGSAHMQKIADLLTAAGGRGKGGVAFTGGEYTFGKNGGFVKAWKQGTLKAQMLADVAEIKASPVLGTMKVATRDIGRAMSDIASPLFEKYIPKMKNGAFYNNMSAWLERNPGASQEEQVAAARQVWDSIDNRFGEMVKDNIFWDQTMKQVAQLAARSYSWDLGTVREIGGGVKDLVEHKWTPRAAYAITLPIADGILAAIYQYAKTGQGPQTPMDLAAPRTGGVNNDGIEERAAPIGYMKDVYGWMEDPLAEATNKIATLPTLVGQLARNKDWRGLPIAPPSDPEKSAYENTLRWLEPYLKTVGQAFVPISMKNAFKRQPDSNISIPEKILGVQSAGQKYTQPEQLENTLRFLKDRDYKTKERLDAREKEKYGGTDQ